MPRASDLGKGDTDAVDLGIGIARSTVCRHHSSLSNLDAKLRGENAHPSCPAAWPLKWKVTAERSGRSTASHRCSWHAPRPFLWWLASLRVADASNAIAKVAARPPLFEAVFGDRIIARFLAREDICAGR